MTREEALKTLKGETGICCSEKWNEALNIVIEQDEILQKESEDFRDYIDKVNRTNSQLIQLIEKHKMKGKWILLDECANSGYYCSECHKKVVKEGWNDTVKKIKYCPNCGADMREVEE